MRNDKLRGVLEGLGFTDVESVISSGNLLFEAGRRRGRSLEDLIEAAWPERLGFRSTTIVRSPRQLREAIDAAPFDGHDDEPTARLQVTFLKRPPGPALDAVPSGGEGWSVHGHTEDLANAISRSSVHAGAHARRHAPARTGPRPRHHHQDLEDRPPHRGAALTAATTTRTHRPDRASQA